MDKIKNRISSFLDSLSEDCLYSDVSDSTLKFEWGLVITSTNYGDCHNAVACDRSYNKGNCTNLHPCSETTNLGDCSVVVPIWPGTNVSNCTSDVNLCK